MPYNYIMQSVTYRYPKFLVPGIFHFPGGIETGIGTNWYQKKVSEPVSEKFDTGTEFCRQNLGILKIYNGYRYRIGTGTGNFSFLDALASLAFKLRVSE